MLLRIILALIGLAFAGVVTISLGSNVITSIQQPAEPSAEHEFHEHPRPLKLASNGPFGSFDRQQVQRGYQVYKEVCKACHGLSLVSFRNLEQLGYNEAEVKAEAAQYEVAAINPETGEPTTRKAVPSDHFPSPYPNETAARAANNNALPPDLSLITKAREGGAAYVHSLLTGYRNQQGYKNEKGQELLKEFPAAKTPPGLYFNPWFPNLNIAMPQPITQDGQVTYADGTKATVDQMAKDVSAFLVWTAEPKLENRHHYGWTVLTFLLVATILGYLAYREIWANAKRVVRPTGPLEPENQAKSNSAKRDQGVAG